MAVEMRNLRLGIGMGLPEFAKVLGFSLHQLNGREYMRTPWGKDEVKAAAEAIGQHLHNFIKKVESIQQPTTPQNS